MKQCLWVELDDIKAAAVTGGLQLALHEQSASSTKFLDAFYKGADGARGAASGEGPT